MIDPEKNRYYSSSNATKFLLDNTSYISLEEGDVVFEPCVGAGSLLPFLKNKGVRIVTNDIDISVDADYQCDIVTSKLSLGEVSHIITNPPYQTYKLLFDDSGEPILGKNGKQKKQRLYHAVDFLKSFAEYSPNTISLLLRNNFLEATSNRKALYEKGFIKNSKGEKYFLKEVICTPRISFTSDGNKDMISTSWFIFVKEEKLKETTTILKWAF